jgi:drug/metabolite transporter (DMT)-like permease
MQKRVFRRASQHLYAVAPRSACPYVRAMTANTIYRSPVVLLVLACAFWGGNVVVGRAVVETIPPVALAFWRWALAFALLTPFALGAVRAAWPAVRAGWMNLAASGVIGVGLYNTLVYLALEYTTAINATVVFAAMPMMIAGLGWLVFRDPFNRFQAAGMALSAVGVAILIARGDPAALLALDFNRGDLLVLVACLCWAVFSLLLRGRPKELRPVGLLYAQVFFGALSLLPFYLWELALAGRSFAPTAAALGAIGYVAIFPSLLSFFFWNRAVELAGPATAGLFLNLIPVFASLLSIGWLGEAPQPYHALSMMALFAGLLLATRKA